MRLELLRKVGMIGRLIERASKRIKDMTNYYDEPVTKIFFYVKTYRNGIMK